MGSILNKVRDFLLPSDESDYANFDESYETEEVYEEDVKETPNIRIMPKPETEEQTVLVKKPARSECKHIDFTPYSFEDLSLVVDALQTGKAVILHLDTLPAGFCQRVIDFCCGVVCSLGCISEMPDCTDSNPKVLILIPDDAERFGV